VDVCATILQGWASSEQGRARSREEGRAGSRRVAQIALCASGFEPAPGWALPHHQPIHHQAPHHQVPHPPMHQPLADPPPLPTQSHGLYIYYSSSPACSHALQPQPGPRATSAATAPPGPEASAARHVARPPHPASATQPTAPALAGRQHKQHHSHPHQSLQRQSQQQQLQSSQLHTGQLQSGQLDSGQLHTGQPQSGQLQSAQLPPDPQEQCLAAGEIDARDVSLAVLAELPADLQREIRHAMLAAGAGAGAANPITAGREASRDAAPRLDGPARTPSAAHPAAVRSSSKREGTGAAPQHAQGHGRRQGAKQPRISAFFSPNRKS
jgi:hypothetical protein